MGQATAKVQTNTEVLSFAQNDVVYCNGAFAPGGNYDSEQSMMTEDAIREALRDCYDPEIPLNIVELGLVLGIELELDSEAPGAGIDGVPDRYSVVVTLLPTGREDGLEAQLLAVIRNRLAGLAELSRIRATVVPGESWTPARMTEAGRRMLRLDQPQFPILNNRVR